MVAERAETVFVEARKMSFVWKREKGIDIVSLFPAVRSTDGAIFLLSGSRTSELPMNETTVSKLLFSVSRNCIENSLEHIRPNYNFTGLKTKIKQKLSAL